MTFTAASLLAGTSAGDAIARAHRFEGDPRGLDVLRTLEEEGPGDPRFEAAIVAFVSARLTGGPWEVSYDRTTKEVSALRFRAVVAAADLRDPSKEITIEDASQLGEGFAVGDEVGVGPSRAELEAMDIPYEADHFEAIRLALALEKAWDVVLEDAVDDATIDARLATCRARFPEVAAHVRARTGFDLPPHVATLAAFFGGEPYGEFAPAHVLRLFFAASGDPAWDKDPRAASAGPFDPPELLNLYIEEEWRSTGIAFGSKPSLLLSATGRAEVHRLDHRTGLDALRHELSLTFSFSSFDLRRARSLADDAETTRTSLRGLALAAYLARASK